MPSRYHAVYKKFSCENKECTFVEPFSMETKILVDAEGSHAIKNYDETPDEYILKEKKCPKCGGRLIHSLPKHSGICGYNAKLCDFNSDGTPGPLHWKSNTSFRDASKVYLGLKNPY